MIPENIISSITLLHNKCKILDRHIIRKELRTLIRALEIKDEEIRDAVALEVESLHDELLDKKRELK